MYLINPPLTKAGTADALYLKQYRSKGINSLSTHSITTNLFRIISVLQLLWAAIYPHKRKAVGDITDLVCTEVRTA